jgi:hypothetical protein
MKRTRNLNIPHNLFAIRREISLWMCLFAVMFQLGAPLVQAATFNAANAAWASMDGALPVEICSGNEDPDALNALVDQQKSNQQNPAHHHPACEVCRLLSHQQLADKIILVSGLVVAARTFDTPVEFVLLNLTSTHQRDFGSLAIRAPPFSV